MTRKILFALCGLLISTTATAQEYGLTIGIHQTTATIDNAAGVSSTVTGKLGFDAGLTVAFELIPQVRFRSGLLYNQRQFEHKITAPVALGTYNYNFAYLDVPVNAQYNFNDMIGLYGGLIVGIKASDEVAEPAGVTAVTPNMKSLYPLMNVGANFMFEDMIGFDVYYERGLGTFAESASNYSTFGMHFIYWM